MMGGMGGFGLLTCLVGLALTAIVIAGVVALILWAAQNTGAKPAAAPEFKLGPKAPEEMSAGASVGKSEPRVCPNCGQAVQVGWSHCAHCGAPLT